MRIVSLAKTGIYAAADDAARILRDGGIVLYPTDTLYGLAVDMTNPEALAQLYELKGREKGKPVSFVVPDIDAIGTYGVLNDAAQALAERFLPGPLTLVLEATSEVPKELAPEGLVGIRIPDDPFCLALARALGRPYTATSANISGELTRATVPEILDQLGRRASLIALAIDDGSRTGGIGSTVVAVRDGEARILREGALSRTTLGI
jgi:L-threonylcarbamoyladenylate synthase